jgi:glucose/arabinose dehydrogenase/mono/diheme cytochrome c family protein
MKKQLFNPLLTIWLAGSILALSPIATKAQTTKSPGKANAGLTLPMDFKASIIADSLGKARHLTVTPQGDIYVRLARPKEGKGTLVLHESNGKARVKGGFGNYGGTGIYLKNGYLYASSNQEVYRYKLNANNEVINPDAPEKIVTGLIDRGQHETKSLVMDNDGNLYVTIGAPSNSCQEKDRQKGSLGMKDCPLLDSTGGVWQFKSDKLNQTYKDGVRYATGLRNVVGIDWNQQKNQLFVMQHGRDQLNNIFPDMYTVKQSAELPAECMYALNKGDNAGWPYIYYDGFQKKKMLAPEYGGDGKKEGSNEYVDPVVAFPAHIAPNGLLFYTGNLFPEKYKNGAFIAFHGSWNRAPEPQAGYFIAFQPFKDGKPAGKWEVFAEGFSGSPEKTASGRADHRPCGLAQGPDGALYVSDDNRGTIYKITYKKGPTDKKGQVGSKSTATQGTSAQSGANSKSTGTKTAAAATGTATSLKASITAGKSVFTQNCVVCHQVDGGGVPNMNPPLSKTSYVLGEKPRLVSVLLKGMSQQEIDGETYTNVMPSFEFLTDKQIADVLTYVRNSFGNKASAVTESEVKALRTQD